MGHEHFHGVKEGLRKFFGSKRGATKNLYFSRGRGGMKIVFIDFGPEKFDLHIFVNFNVLNTMSCKIWRKLRRFASHATHVRS